MTAARVPWLRWPAGPPRHRFSGRDGRPRLWRTAAGDGTRDGQLQARQRKPGGRASAQSMAARPAVLRASAVRHPLDFTVDRHRPIKGGLVGARTTWSFVFVCIVALLASSAVLAVEVPAGPIWNNIDAQGKCPNVCQGKGNSRWNGQWRTLPGTSTSVCDCDAGASPVNPPPQAQWTPAGPLFNQMEAQNRCPGVCQQNGNRSWDGNWKTTEPGRMSVCSCAGDQGAWPAYGPGASCSARGRGGCAGCSVQCAPGQRASCQEGSTWNDRLNNGNEGCVANAQCTCG